MATKTVNLARQLVTRRHMKFYKEMMTTEFKMPAPRKITGTEAGYCYTSNDMRAVIEQCAQLARDAEGPRDAEYEIRNLLEQVK